MLPCVSLLSSVFSLLFIRGHSFPTRHDTFDWSEWHLPSPLHASSNTSSPSMHNSPAVALLWYFFPSSPTVPCLFFLHLISPSCHSIEEWQRQPLVVMCHHRHVHIDALLLARFHDINSIYWHDYRRYISIDKLSVLSPIDSKKLDTGKEVFVWPSFFCGVPLNILCVITGQGDSSISRLT